MSVTVKMKVNMDFSVILVCVIMQNKVPDVCKFGSNLTIKTPERPQ